LKKNKQQPSSASENSDCAKISTAAQDCALCTFWDALIIPTASQAGNSSTFPNQQQFKENMSAKKSLHYIHLHKWVCVSVKGFNGCNLEVSVQQIFLVQPL